MNDGKMKGLYKEWERNIEKNKEMAAVYATYQIKLHEAGYEMEYGIVGNGCFVTSAVMPSEAKALLYDIYGDIGFWFSLQRANDHAGGDGASADAVKRVLCEYKIGECNDDE